MKIRTFKAYFRKEMIESIRHHRYLVLVLGFVLFAILDPIMVKLIPYFLKGQLPEELIKHIVFTPIEGANNYIKDVFQFANLIVVLSLMGIINDEITTQKFVFPWSKGARVEGVVLAKYLHYSIVILFGAVVGFMVNTYYTNMLFAGNTVTYAAMLRSALLFSQYYLFALAFLFFFSSILKRGIGGAIVVLLFNYFSPIFINIAGIAKWLSYNLVAQANIKAPFTTTYPLETLVITMVYIVVLLALTIRRVKKVEVI